jgi:hypothetical protein
MATIYKILGQSSPLATTETDLYTVPALTSAVCSSISICNRGGTQTTFRVSISQGGGSTVNKIIFTTMLHLQAMILLLQQ